MNVRLFPAVLLLATAVSRAEEPALYRSDSFALFPDSVVQGPFVARAADRDTIVTNYPRAAREVMFKFSINGTENEFAPGTDHMIVLRPSEGRIVTPVFRFGFTDPPSAPRPSAGLPSEEGRAAVTFRLDMRYVLASFRETGAYDPPNGPPIAAGDFEAVYIVGNTPPLGWDFPALRPGSPFQLHDRDGDGIYTVTLDFHATYNRPVDREGRAYWKRSADLERFPEYSSPQPLVDAIYRLSLEELAQLTREDGAIVAGERWPDVWTRDLAWGAILAFAPLAPDQVRTSLMMKVDANGRIIQDTGTGGSWPVSTDRMAWAVAAWELYEVTGDRDWLRQSFDVIRRSAQSDLHAAFDDESGLVFGESSFLDWRDQSYPRWMEPRDIYRSQSLGTNALHYAAWDILAKMARELGEPAAVYETTARRIREAMNAYLWQSDRGYYAQFRYGRNHPALSPRAEGLGEAFAILFGVASAEQRARIARDNPVTELGVPSFWPYIPDVPPYHNAGIWPQVVGFWTWAAAEAGSGAAVEHGLASILRATAFFLTNKENMVSSTGHFEGTELNSDRLVGSVGAALATVQRVLLGMRYHPDRLELSPFVPPAWDGERTLRGLRYRGAILDITIRGYGDGVTSATLDGVALARAEIPATLEGRHQVTVTMNRRVSPSSIRRVPDAAAPATPEAELLASGSGGVRLAWKPVGGAVGYGVYRNGMLHRITRDTSIDLPEIQDTLVELQVLAFDTNGHESFLSEPLRHVDPAAVMVVQPPDVLVESRHGGFTGRGYVPLTVGKNDIVLLSIDIASAGTYAVDVRYANGSGPVNSGDRAAIRTLFVDGTRAGVLVMPQRGTNAWDDWGYSSPVHVRFRPGRHSMRIRYTPEDRNMSGEINDALLDHVRLTRIAPW